MLLLAVGAFLIVGGITILVAVNAGMFSAMGLYFMAYPAIAMIPFGIFLILLDLMIAGRAIWRMKHHRRDKR